MPETNGHVEEIGGSWAVMVDGEIVALRPDRGSAEKCLLEIYLFRKDAEPESEKQ